MIGAGWNVVQASAEPNDCVKPDEQSRVYSKIVTFDKDYLRDLYETGKGDKKHRFQPDIVKRYKNRIDTLKNKENIEALYNMASLHYEVLKGDKAGISSIRVNDQYRIEFTVSYQETETIIYICNILDLSNHYQ